MKKIRIAEPILGSEVEELVVSVLRSGHLAQGPMVQRFEGLCAQMAGSDHAVAFANGTLALEATLRGLGIGEGDEVVTTPFTFVATVNAVLATGAKVRFADIGDDLNLDPAATEDAINPKTRAILPVHLYGLPADLVRFAELAEKHGLALIEDAAQAHGASVGDRPVGGYGTGVFSFYATKNVTAGEGGVVTTSDAELDARLRILRHQGMRGKYEYEVIGSNLRMTDVQAAIAIPQLEGLDELMRKRSENAEHLFSLLEQVDGLGLPKVPSGRSHAWHQFTVLLPDGVDRTKVVEVMTSSEIEVLVYYPKPIWDYPPYADNPSVMNHDTPNAVAASQRCLSLPVHPGLDKNDLQRVAETFVEALGR